MAYTYCLDNARTANSGTTAEPTWVMIRTTLEPSAPSKRPSPA